MTELTTLEQKFFEMLHSKETKKISMNLSTETIEKIDEFAATFSITRTLVIEAVLLVGFPEYLNLIESMNKKQQKQQPDNKKLVEMFKNIEIFRHKWKIS